MSDALNCLSLTLVDPDETAAVGALAFTLVVPISMTIVFVSVDPLEDDAGATIDINDDGAAAIAGIDASDKSVPGTWSSTHFDGTNEPVQCGR